MQSSAMSRSGAGFAASWNQKPLAQAGQGVMDARLEPMHASADMNLEPKVVTSSFNLEDAEPSAKDAADIYAIVAAAAARDEWEAVGRRLRWPSECANGVGRDAVHGPP